MGSVLLILGSCASLQVGAALAVQLFALGGSAGTTLLRLGLAALVLLAVVRPRVRRWTRTQWQAAVTLGVCLGAMNGLFYAALSRIDLGVAVTVEFLGPLTLAAVTSRRGRDLLWVALALVGVVVLGTTGEHAGGLDPAGVGLALLAGACWAGYILASARVGRVVPGHGGLAVATTVAALALVPLGLSGALQAVQAPGGLQLAFGTALLASVVPYSLELAALRRLPERTFGVLLSLEPVVASLAGWALLGQGMTAFGGLGVVLVVLASAGVTWGASRRSGEPSGAPSESGALSGEHGSDLGGDRSTGRPIDHPSASAGHPHG